MNVKRLLFVILALFGVGSCMAKDPGKKPVGQNSEYRMNKNLKTAIFGGGCFWCTEAAFQNFRGVAHVESGYAGGPKANPTYEEVSSGGSGHAEVIRIYYDPAQITYTDLLEIFFHAHDPTTLNQQGADRGTQYRSIILYQNESEKSEADSAKKKFQEQGLWKDPIVTEIVPLTEFYVAEDYHQDYYRANPSQRYCSIVIAPKLQKLYKQFASKLDLDKK